MVFMSALFHPHFVQFIVYFNENQDFFECHEVLEEYWKSFPDKTKEHPLTAYILYATSAYHWRRENFIGAEKSIQKALVRMKKIPTVDPEFLSGIQFETLLADMENVSQKISTRQPFVVPPIIITSDQLQEKVARMKGNLVLLPANSEAIIHKHNRRNRT